MTEGHTTADPLAWQNAKEYYDSAKEFFEESGHPPLNFETRELFAQLIEAEAALLALPAPDLSAVATKLSIIFDAEMCHDEAEASAKRKCIGDLRRLEFEACEGDAEPKSRSSQ